MGMSASQARLIQLTARMSDVEYEGQQINQQRLALSNKMSDIYAQMEGMIVPTPPSPYDYMDTTYTGKDADGNTVNIKPTGEGNEFTVGFPTKGTTLIPQLDTATEATIYEFKEETAPKPQNSITASFDQEIEYPCYKYQGKQVSTEDYETAKKDAADAKDAAEKARSAVGTEPKVDDNKYTKTREKTVDNKTTTESYQDEAAWQTDHDAWEERDKAAKDKESVATNLAIKVKEHTPDKYYGTDETKKATYTSTNGSHVPERYQHPHGLNSSGEGNEIDYTFTDSYGEEKSGGSKDLQEASSFYSAAQIAQIMDGVYYVSNTVTGTKLTQDDLAGLAKGEKKIYTRTESKSLGGAESLTYSEAKAKYAQNSATSSKWADVEKALQNYLKGFLGQDEQGNSSYADAFTADDADKKGIMIAFDGTNFKIFENTNPDDKENKNYRELKIGQGQVDRVYKGTGTFSNAGNLNGVTLPDGSTVTAKKEEVLNQTAMGAATAEYEAKKAEYDKEQDALNHETSKIQLEDKKLDLKLKRLDTERNALNTEIDAVKKVIQDAVDKGFKTFSG